jgi:hypothetical protein
MHTSHGVCNRSHSEARNGTRFALVEHVFLHCLPYGTVSCKQGVANVRKVNVSGYVVVGVVVTMATALAIQNQRPRNGHAAATDSNNDTADDADAPQKHAVIIREPRPPADVKTGQLDSHGQSVSLTCRNCHDVQPVNRENSATEHLDKFHQGLAFNHGKLACVSCHNAQDGYTTLHLADGAGVEYAATMKLCAQCHGTQYRDYQHGSHGGMTGYWDLSKGPRQRNHCVDCHDPHAPQFPAMYPAAGPNDRFLPTQKDAVH